MASTRRLAAIMFTDVVGFTALAQRDEAAALRILDEHRRLLRPLFRDHSGREVKTTGDAFLVEFGNALDAARCAIEIQKALHERNSKTSGTKIELRIGLHVGDVEPQNGDILGDAVNIVSRIEPKAEPGGICVSGDVYNQVRNKVDVVLAALGATALKNVEFPVPLYRVELPWMVTSLGRRTPWVARPAEQELLRKAVERAAKGDGSALVLVGESGIGKTRLAEEMVQLAERSGFRFLRGRAFPGELSTPFSHWAEMVREFLRDAPPPIVYKVSSTVAAEVAKLAPELSEKVGPVPPGLSGDPDTARTRFFDGVTRFFINLSQESPLVLLLDDLQWADAASLGLLECAIRSVPGHRLLLLGTSQEPEADGSSPLSELLRYLTKDGLLTTVPIHRMDPGSVGEMIKRTFGEAEVSEEFQALIHERTGGNPLFVEEVLRSLVEEGSIYRTEEGRWERKEIHEIGIPKTVREVVKQRVNRLDEPTQSTLRIAAVLGTDFPFDVLREVAGLEEDRLIEQLERLVRTELIEETKSRTLLLSYSFLDPQLRRVLYDEMLSPRRVRYHRKAAEVLEKLVQNRTEEFAGDLAYHSREGHDLAKARGYSVLAADRWAKLFAFAEAEQQYRTALELLEEAPDDGVRARVLDGLGGTHLALGRADRTVGEWGSAIRLYEAQGEPLKAGWLCRQLADVVRLRSELAPGQPNRVEELLETGRRLLESAPPSRELASLYDESSARLADQGLRAQGRLMAEKAIAVARAIGDKDAEMRVYDELAMTVPLGEKEKVFEYFEAKEKYFSQPGKEDWDQVSMTRGNLSDASLGIASDAPSALRWAELAIEAAQKIRNQEMEAFFRTVEKVPALLWTGDVVRAGEELRQVRELLNLPPDSHNLAFERALARLALARGDLDEAALHFSRIEVSPQDYGTFLYHSIDRAELHRRRQEPNEAVSVLRQAVDAEPGVVTDLEANNARGSLRVRAALIETLLESPEVPRRDDEVSRRAGELHEIATTLGDSFGLALDQRVQGEIARQEGCVTDAVTRFEEAVGWFRKSGNVAELARTLQLLSEVCRGAGQLERAESAGNEAAGLIARFRESAK